MIDDQILGVEIPFPKYSNIIYTEEDHNPKIFELPEDLSQFPIPQAIY